MGIVQGELGNVLRHARKEHRLTQADLVARAGTRRRTVSNIETSASGAKVDTIFDLLAALDLELHIVPRRKMKPGDLEDIFKWGANAPFPRWTST